MKFEADFTEESLGENFYRYIIGSTKIGETEDFIGEQKILVPIYEYTLTCKHKQQEKFSGGMKPYGMECQQCKNNVNQKIAFITGANGQDSKTLIHFLLSKNYKIIVGCRHSSSFDFDSFKQIFSSDLKGNLNSTLDSIRLDLNDEYSISHAIKESTEKYGKINELYHLGGISSVPDSFNNPGMCIHVNGQSCYYLLEALRNFSPETKFFYASSSETFKIDETKEYYNEESPRLGLNPYAVSKTLGENWVKFFREVHGIFAVNGILFPHSNIYRHNSFFTMKLCQNAVKIHLGMKSDAITVGPLDFWRDECCADFIIEGMWKMLQLEKPIDLVLGNGVLHSGYNYVNFAFRNYQLDPKQWLNIEKSLTRSRHDAKIGADTTKAQNLINWQNNKINLKEHIKNLCLYWENFYQ